MGRPREFDIDKAVDTAMDMFWRNGYDRTSLSDLTGALKITPPSFYFAFGSKEALFKQALDRYQSGQMGFVEDALRRPTARETVETFLYRKVDAHTDPSHPPGCLVVNCSLPCSAEEDPIRQELAVVREFVRGQFQKRFKQAQADGDLASNVDISELARYVMVVSWGLAAEAQAGASRKALYHSVAMAMRSWPEDGEQRPRGEPSSLKRARRPQGAGRSKRMAPKRRSAES